MKRWGLTILHLFVLLYSVTAQISYGGKPLPVDITTRSSEVVPFEEMPPFDLEEELRLDSVFSDGMRGNYKFGYKFVTNLTPVNSGRTVTLADGTRVWRLGIRSKGALSINLLFTEFDIPEGARLFLYNPSQTHVLGSFTHRNHSESGLFPVSPVAGDELIIEYQEPPHVPFTGKLTVGEVNHAYRPLRDREPDGFMLSHACMAPLACFPDDPLITPERGRSVVLLIIDGTNACTGVLLNNTSHDGSPYILTASHCINKDFSIKDPKRYELIAGSIVCFFNYSSPTCDPVLRGTEEMSMASTRLRAHNEYMDMALLELEEIPPVYYQPYYSGWNLSETPSAPCFGIHHPRATMKRVNWLDETPELSTFDIRIMDFYEDAHWHVKRWTAGSTDGGSSGSPLYDGQGRVIGALSGGYSLCREPVDDYYFALRSAWTPLEPDDAPSVSERQLSHWLDPLGKNTTVCDGLDPYEMTEPCIRLSHIQSNGNVDKILVDTLPGSNIVPLYGNNAYEISTYVEQYHVQTSSLLYGTYLVAPSIGVDYSPLEIEICVYEGNNGPERLIHTEKFCPTYTDFSRRKREFTEQVKPLDRAQETFVPFRQPVRVKGHFFVGYRIVSAPENVYFAAFNLPATVVRDNTTWLLHKEKWLPATAHPVAPKKNALFIDPVIRKNSNGVNNERLAPETSVYVIMGADRRSIHIVLPEITGRASFSLVSVNGQIVQEERLSSVQNTVLLSGHPSGVYIVRVVYDGKPYVQKIVI